MANEVDFSQEAEELLQDISNIFANDSLENIKQNIENIRAKLQIIQQQLEDATGPNDILRKQTRKNLTIIMKTAYQAIMAIRTQLLGTSQQITYRLYIKNGKEIKVIDISEEQLMSITERSGNTLRLKRYFNEIEKSTQNTIIEGLMDQHFNNIINSFDINKGHYTVKMSVIGQYGDPPNLVWPIDLNGVGKSWRTPKIFNLGWIYQAFDATVYDLYAKQKETMLASLTDFHRSYFVDHLKYDNVVGFKGGDVGLNQIKGNMASLMSITTLKKYLGFIIQILSPGEFENKEALSAFIKNKFLDTKEPINDELNNFIDEKSNDLLKIFK